MKKIISYLLVIIFIFQFNTISALADELSKEIETIEVEEVEDKAAPEISDLKFEKSVIAGQVLSITVDVKDELSKVKEVILNYSDKDGNKEKDMELLSEDTYKVDISTTEDMSYEKIQINSITTCDELNNKKTFNIKDSSDINTSINITDKDGVSEKTELKINNFTSVYSDNLNEKAIDLDEKGNIDNEAPIFNSISISKDKAKVGDTIDIIVDAIDAESGMNEVIVNYSYGYDDNYKLNMNLEYDSSIDKFKGSILVTEDMLYKVYHVNSVNLYDKADNGRFKSFSEPYEIIFTDDTNKSDTDLPILKNMKLDKSIAKVGDKVKISIEAFDNTTEITRVFYGYRLVENYYYIELVYNNLTNRYEGEIVINNSMEGNALIPNSLSIYDSAENVSSKDYYELNDLLIKVPDKNGNIDTEAPKLLNVKLDKTIANVGENVKIYVDALDNYSGISKISVRTEDDSDNKDINLTYNTITKKYEGLINIEESYSYHKINILSIFILDAVGNYNVIYYDNIIGDKSVVISDLQGKFDKIIPSLNEYINIKNRYTQGEAPVIKIKATDDLSGIKNINVYGENKDGTIKYSGNSTCDDNNIAYVYLGNYKNKLINDKIFIKTIIIEDYSGNTLRYDRSQKDFTNLDFIIGNYMDNQEVIVDADSIYYGDRNIKGKVSRNNIKIKIKFYDKYRYCINNLEEVTTNENGEFNIEVYPEGYGDYYSIEAYDLETNKFLGYTSIQINRNPDVVKDGVIDIQDLARVAFDYGQNINTKSGIKTDINNDNYIDIFDLILVSKRIN